MPTAIKISTELAEEARAAAADADRSLTGQIEHWARIGKSIEPRLSSAAVAALKRSGGELSALEDAEERTRVMEALDELRSRPPFQVTTSYLREMSGPLYEAHPSDPERVVKVDATGEKIPGRFVNREFVAD